ncbi:50S ribosomal protein L5 [Eubacterium plexicaudatum ASF492]|nr:50S ribosomal protein L5 [Eubacterium plexicaudatum ASF492]
MSRLKDQYMNEIIDAMIKKFGYKNRMQVPKLDKIVVNMGIGEAKENAKVLEAAMSDMELITGQKPIKTISKNQSQTSRSEKGCQSAVR